MDAAGFTRSIFRIDLARAWRHAPAVATSEVMGAACGTMFITGGIEVLSCAPLLEPAADVPVIIAIGVFAILKGALCFLCRIALPRWFYFIFTLVGSVLITLAVLKGGSRANAMAFSVNYLFVVVNAFFFFSIRAALIQYAFLLACVLLAFERMDITAVGAIMLIGSSLTIAVIVMWLSRVSDEAEEDHLTRLLNRRGLGRQVQLAIRRATDHGTPLMAAALDLDDFKQYNDTFGHLEGDRLLVECATAWCARLPAGAHLGRYGGDEFVLVLPGFTLGAAAALTDSLREATPGATASAGVAAWVKGDSMSMLMSRADAALYEAKVTGRNRTAVHGDPGRAARELEAATEAGELRVHYQPIVRLDTGETVGYEALMRWQHPQRGLIGPAAFIPDAERSGAIHAIGRWLVQRVISDIAAHPERMVRVGINVSVRELQRADYADMVISLLRDSGVRGGTLVIEITESALADSDEPVHRTLQKLRDNGVLVAVDDLGAGYSSLRRIQSLPLDFIKLDGSMMRMIPEQGDKAPILEALVSMGNSLGVRMVAEWVETPHQAEVLRSQGYFLGQGYLFGKPLPLEELPASA